MKNLIQFDNHVFSGKLSAAYLALSFLHDALAAAAA